MNSAELGVKKFVNISIRLYLKNRYKRLLQTLENPHFAQNELLENLLYTASETEYGQRYRFNRIHNYDYFRKHIPLVEYDDLREDILRMMDGKRDVLWPGQVKWFSKSSGTTSRKSKFIPVSKENLKECHIKGSWDTLAIHYNNIPEAKIFEYKNLIIGGTLYQWPTFPETTYGDISAIMIHHMPFVGRPYYSPDFETIFMKNWEEKLEMIARNAACDPAIGSIGGVPTWNIVLFKKILELTGKEHLLEVWPDLHVYLHGGVNFKPYKAQFQQLIPRDDFIYQEIYNASEGYFASQTDYQSDDMLLFLENGVFFEFVPVCEIDAPHPNALCLAEVETGVNYALVITTNSGLWRYKIGDTIEFTSLDPYKIRITGRTKHFINAFGEEVMVSNTDQAISEITMETGIKITDYTVAPIYMDINGKGAHQWLVEFEENPENIELFAQNLDQKLQRINSDYEAKRYKSMALECLQIIQLPKGSFQSWLNKANKLGAQAKIPRLSNNRSLVDEMLSTLNV